MRARLLVAVAPVLAAASLAAPSEARVNAQNAGLQVALRAWGHYFGPVDGIAGPMTQRAVRDFQRRKALVVDGIAGPRTRRALGRLGHPLYGKRVLRRGMVGWDVSVLQFLLTRRGTPTGIIDGYFGGETVRALRRFQRRARIGADGIAGPRTRRALGGTPAGRPSRPESVRGLINHWAGNYGMNPALVRALAWIESGFQPHVVSRAGAFGVMQVTPATWDFVEEVLVGRRIARTVSGNIHVGVAYLHWLVHEFDGNVRLALAAYNQGPRSVRRNGLFRETRRFVGAVLASVGRV
jgi:transglycosylase-like protein with SLT domain/putative peptidoglycan binding protein